MSGPDRLPDMKRADWWWEAGWARWALQEISISRQRGITVESKNKPLALLFHKQEAKGERKILYF